MPGTIDRKVPPIRGDIVRGLRYRVPADVHPVLADVADFAAERIIDVMTEQVDPMNAGNVLKAAQILRDEICGPIAKKVEVKVGLAQLLADAGKMDEKILEAVDVTPMLPDVDEDVFPDLESRREKAPAEPEGPTGAGDDQA